MSNFNQYRNMTRVSGGQVSRNAKKIAGCDNCNFMELHDKAIRTPVLKTGEACPRCKEKSVRIYDSQAEFTRGQELKLMQAQGVIRDLKYQVRFDLHVFDKDGKKVKLYTYVTDFTYVESLQDVEEYIVEDVKGNVITETAAIKLKHFELEYGIGVRIVKR